MTNHLRPGDCAWVVNCEAPQLAWTISRVVQVAMQCDCEGARMRGRGGPVWQLARPLIGQGSMVLCLPEWCLKRIPPLATPAPGQREPMTEEVVC
jgi:hypothetical protein